MEIRKPDKVQGQSSSAEADHACQLLRQEDGRGLDMLVDLYYPVLGLMAGRLLNDRKRAEDLAKDAFICLWQKRQELSDLAEVKTFLFDTVLASCRKAAGQSQGVQTYELEQPFTALAEALITDLLIRSINAYDQPAGTETGELDYTDKDP